MFQQPQQVFVFCRKFFCIGLRATIPGEEKGLRMRQGMVTRCGAYAAITTEESTFTATLRCQEVNEKDQHAFKRSNRSRDVILLRYIVRERIGTDLSANGYNVQYRKLVTG